MIRAGLIATLLALASPVSAAPNEQLLRSIEHRLAFWNVGPVDYNALTTSQAAALHMKLTNAPSRFSGRSHMFRQELLTILSWDGSEKNYSLNKSD
ncbi:hypothetical protein BCF46_2897 [Litoreibacter meonggei]|uniref:Uncharacterized protein n=1 Tax=Litoreibacter meonggei TaxID=1049199 RepID=A0A497VSS0_9RHOB|nr:hypothetical protein [Litoreibacter meonggei]RLJ41109.1 hypothetical protein BCF46_2897 [Litoreibacter meonggei]